MDINAWHEHCILRDDVRQGTLELAEFAADLYAVRMEDAPNVYQVPTLFFDRTYPTYNLKTLARNRTPTVSWTRRQPRHHCSSGLRRWKNPRPDCPLTSG